MCVSGSISWGNSHEWRHLVFILLNPCFRIFEKWVQVHLANKCGCWTLNPGLSDFKTYAHSTTPGFCPFNLVVIWWVSCIFQDWGCLALFHLLIEDTMFLTQNQVCGLKAYSQIGDILFKVSRDWFQPDGSCQGLLGQIYTRDHKLHDSENKGNGITKDKLRVKALKWENKSGGETLELLLLLLAF